MVAIVGGGSTTGLASSSLKTLGNAGVLGDPALGRNGDKVYVNAASGNLVVQHQDEAMAALGGDVDLLRTYNSLGLIDGDNNDGWQLGAVKTLSNLTGTLNASGSTVTLTDTDGSTFVYKFVNNTIGYQCTSGEGAYDRLKYTNGLWTWTDGASQRTETYDWTSYQGLDSRNRPVTVYSGKILSSSDTEQNTRNYSYDAFGNGFLLRSIVSASVGSDGMHERLDFAWSNGMLQSVTRVTADGPSQHIGYSYDPGTGFLSAITISGVTPAGGGAAPADTISYQYQNNLLWKIVQPDGSVTTITYVAGTGKVSQIDQGVNGDVTRTTRFTYNSTTQTTITDPLGNNTVMNFNSTGALVSVKQPGGEVVTYAYDTNGNLTSVTDARSNVTTYTYDSATGNRLSQKDAAGNTVSWTYGSKNEVLTRTDYFVPAVGGTAASDAHLTRYAYDDKDRLRFVVSPEGRVSEYRYALDALGRRVSEFQYSAALYPASGTVTESALQTWIAGLADRSQVQTSTTFYDARGQVQQVRRYTAVLSNGMPVEDGAVSVTNYTYDAWGRLLNTSSTDGGSASYVYDWLGRMVQSIDANNALTTTSYDDVGNTVLTRQVDNLNVTASYNSAGDLVSVEKFTGMLTSRNTQQLTRYWYDAESHLRMSQDPTGLKSYVLYDTDGRKAADIDANGTMTEYVYNANDQLISTTTYANALSTAALASLVDAAGNPAKVTVASLRPAVNAADREVWKLYDLAGRLVKTIDELGQVTETLYDGASRITSVIRYAATVNASAITATTKPTDAAAKPAVSASDEKTRYFYDSDNLLLATLDPAGSLVENEYDAGGRLRHTITWATATNSTLRASGSLAQLRPTRDSAGRDLDSWVFYDRQGRRIGEVDGEGYVNGYVYDLQGHVVEELHADGGEVQNRYDAFGNLLQQRLADGETIAWGYDALGRVISKTIAPNTLVDVYATTVDDTGSWTPHAATQMVGKVLTEIYRLDQLGRRIQTVDANGQLSQTFYDVHGNVLQTVDALGRSTRYAYDAFGHKTDQLDALGQWQHWDWDPFRLSRYQDVGGHITTTSYNGLGKIKTQQSDLGQDLRYTYDSASGLLVKIEDRSLGGGQAQLTQYAYDLAGHHSREKTSIVRIGDGAELDVAQDNHLSWDALGRLVEVSDARQRPQYAYDAEGNMIHQITSYDLDNDPSTAGADAITNWQDSPTTQDLWNSYDAMNRQTVINGRSSNGGASITIDATQGTYVNYDSFGHQITSTGAGTLQNGTRGLVATGYSWDAAGRLADTWRMDAGDIEQRRYDATGHVLQSQQLTSLSSGTLNTIGVNAMLQLSAYDAAGQLKVQALVKGSGQRPSLTTHYEYDAAGRTSSYDMSNHDAGFARRSFYSYGGRGDGSLLAQIKMWSEFDGGALDSVVGQTDNSYDANGFLTGVQGSAQNAQDTRSFINDAQGHVLRKTQVDARDANVFHVTRSLIANGQSLGSSSDTTAPTPSTFGQDYAPVAASGGPMLYTVQAGDTLGSIARNLWGNADWWYVIADANGSSTLTAGQILNIPPKPTALYNSIDTIKPYDAALAMGDLSPNVLPPVGHSGGCGGMGAALAMIVTVVVAAITQQYWLVEEGMAAVEAAGGAAEAAGELALNTLSEATLADIGAAVPGASLTATTLGAAAGSIAGQLTRIASGDQHGFDWKQLGLSTISAGMSYGLSGLELTGMQTANKMAQAVIANALTQGIGVVTGLQQAFNWRAVAASAANAGVNHSTGGWFADKFGGTPLGDLGATLGLGLAGGVAAAAVRGGRVSVGEVALDAFGNALGGSLAREAESASAPGRTAEIVTGPEAADPVLNPPIAADAIAWPDSASVAPDEVAPGIDGGSIDSILRRQGISDGSGYFLSQPSAASAWKMFDGDRAMMGEFKRLNGLADSDAIRADRYYRMPIAGEFDESMALAAQSGQESVWKNKAQIADNLAYLAGLQRISSRYDATPASWTGYNLVAESIVRTERTLDANYTAWALSYNAGVYQYNESLRQPWVESLTSGKYGAEIYGGLGGGIEVGIADGRISDVKFSFGYGRGARYGRMDALVSEALQGRATSYKAEVDGGPWFASAPSMPGELRWGLGVTASGTMPGVSADLLNASAGLSTRASGVVYGQIDRPAIAFDPTQLWRPSSWKPELAAKASIDLSYILMQPKPLTPVPVLRPK